MVDKDNITPDARGIWAEFDSGWQLAIGELRFTTVIYLTNECMVGGYYTHELKGKLPFDLEVLGYEVHVFHDGGEEAPLVVWSHAEGHLPTWTWEPRTNRMYRRPVSRNTGLTS